MNVKTIKTETLEEYVDRLGVIKADMAVLKEQQDAIKKKLLDAGVEEMEGEFYRVTLSTTVRRMLDSALIRKLVPAMLVKRAEKEVVTSTMRVTARKGVALTSKAA